MRLFILLNLVFFSSIVFCQDEEKTHFDFGYFSLDFREGNPSRCDNAGFTQTVENEYLFDYTIDWQYSDNFLFLLYPPYSDSFNLYDRYINCMAIRQSETEGVYPFDTTVSDLNENELFYFSEWVEMKDFSFAKYGRGQTYWQPTITGIDSAAFQRWYISKQLDDIYINSETIIDRREVFCYQRQVKFVLYQNKKKVIVILKFLHRDGEC